VGESTARSVTACRGKERLLTTAAKPRTGVETDEAEILQHKFLISTHGPSTQWSNRFRALLSTGALVFKQDAAVKARPAAPGVSNTLRAVLDTLIPCVGHAHRARATGRRSSGRMNLSRLCTMCLSRRTFQTSSKRSEFGTQRRGTAPHGAASCALEAHASAGPAATSRVRASRCSGRAPTTQRPRGSPRRRPAPRRPGARRHARRAPAILRWARRDARQAGAAFVRARLSPLRVACYWAHLLEGSGPMPLAPAPAEAPHAYRPTPPDPPLFAPEDSSAHVPLQLRRAARPRFPARQPIGAVRQCQLAPALQPPGRVAAAPPPRARRRRRVGACAAGQCSDRL
jgi:hypothetical protein